MVSMRIGASYAQSVHHHVHGDDPEEDAAHRGLRREKAAPLPQQREPAGDEHDERQRDEEDPERPSPARVPHDDALRVAREREVADRERKHEDARRQDEEEVERGDAAFHNVLCSTKEGAEDRARGADGCFVTARVAPEVAPTARPPSAPRPLPSAPSTVAQSPSHPPQCAPVSRLALVIPCYNEEHRLPAEELRNFAVPGLELEIVFVNDGSSDGTLALLEKLQVDDPRRFHLVNLAQNSGKAEAVRQGILAALERKPDYTGFWDADLATPLSELPVFVDILDSRSNVQMVMGARVRLPGPTLPRTPPRQCSGRVGAPLISKPLGVAVYPPPSATNLSRPPGAARHVF